MLGIKSPLILIPFFFSSTLITLTSALKPEFIFNNDEDGCPPCFNCMLPIFECKQYSTCNEYTGQCECVTGFGGQDCKSPVCGGLSVQNDQRPIRNESEPSCDCYDGWGGINCNICQQDSICNAFLPDGVEDGGVCYKQGILVHQVFQGCNVTNPKILSILNGKQPQATFSCNKTSEECGFQFWVDQVESFYCGLDNCTFEYDIAGNTTHYKCENVECKCLPDEFLCGKSGSIDISDFLTETIKGPADFSCDLRDQNCKFSEPSMDGLISNVFGDSCITLHCESGECIHYSEIPGYTIPKNPSNKRAQVITICITVFILGLILSTTINCITNSPLFLSSASGKIKLADDYDDDSSSFSSLLYNDLSEEFLYNTVNATLTFENIEYYVGKNKKTPGSKVLNKVSGIVQPGQIMAIMGGSGAGKTTLLDILAMKNKSGTVEGTIRINGQKMDPTEFRKITGFVDQDDHLFPTLTVYETVLNSALLRLPSKMSLKSKHKRVEKVLKELRIFNIKDKLIGNDFERGISGGEKRRVSIACELVTSPLILFLDEPTSGLDSNNARNVVECLLKLANHQNRTLVVSIHQPRSNIFKMFDRLILLSSGEMCYSGVTSDVGGFLKNCGYECPRDYNIADYLIDVTFDEKDSTGKADIATTLAIDNEEVQPPQVHNIDDELRESNNSSNSTNRNEWEHYAEHRDEIRSLLFKDNDNGNGGGNTISSSKGSVGTGLLCKEFQSSSIYQQLLYDVNMETVNSNTHNIKLPTGCGKASFSEQLSILCSRSFKNVYRNPKLLIGNYLLTVILGAFLGALYYKVEDDISGFQNRLGLFFFIITFFGFLSFTELSAFYLERIIFIKERSNNYYHPLAYFISKILSDVLPLRIIPPFILAIVLYPLVGLNIKDNAFIKFIGILVLFNLSVSFEILTIGIIFEDLNNSIISSVLILLWSILFSGLFINTQDITNFIFKYMKNFSLFYYAYESLIINEVKSLTLKEKKFGLSIEVPGATILSTFGFQVANLKFDILMLCVAIFGFLITAYLILRFFVVENR
ncbi:related to Probable ATP-dependent permease [Saccharomycodes ludwigii]|uniref:Related to Probable ATP-dependent permease n=1 Tax=Saccharomycodes ludwigii TaxID=36035 RepID=A0A376B0N4_9ASCO|nr:related to Probable ATP-dependent permease [Saccharomycodes ludwigii]